MSRDSDRPVETGGSPGSGPDSRGGGLLLVIGTPIGNLGDLSPRAREALARCDVIACEDTRRTGRLLELSGLRAPRLVRLDAHTERNVAPGLIERVRSDPGVLGLVSDAGMPGLSDPGAVLISLAGEVGLDVEVIPGPFAGVVALVASGLLDGDGRFVFEGFLPRKGAERRSRMRGISTEPRTVVIYESPHRVLETVLDLAAALGPNRRASASRELTKLHEETLSGTLAELAEALGRSRPRGEFVLVVEGAPPAPEPTDLELSDAYDQRRSEGMTSRDAVTAVAEQFGVSPNTVKRLAFSSGGGGGVAEPSASRPSGNDANLT